MDVKAPPPPVEKKIDKCCQLSKRANSTFHMAFLFLPAYQRRAMHVLYLFCRKVDDAVDEAGSRKEKLNRLNGLEEALEATDCADSPLWEALAWVRSGFDIPLKYFRDLLAGARTDVGEVRLETMAELDSYCYRVAGTVGLMSLKVMEIFSPQLREPALDLARGFQITNILRDVGEDHERNRCYLPRELLEKHAALEDWEQRRSSPRLRKVLETLARRAGENYRRGIKLLERAGWRQRLTLALMAAAYSRYLERIEEEDFPIWEENIKLKKTAIPGLVFSSLCTLTGRYEQCLQIS